MIASDIQAKVPIESMDVGSFDVMAVRREIGEGQPPTPQQVVLLQELERWNMLALKMATTLGDLQRALVGEIGMSDQLDELGAALYNGRLPGAWKRLAPDTQKPLGSWVEHFLRRHAQYSSWVQNGEPSVMWLSGLHIPESYLTALVQVRLAHEHGRAIPSNKFCNSDTLRLRVGHGTGPWTSPPCTHLSQSTPMYVPADCVATMF